VIWRPVLAKMGTLKEVQYEWDIDDLFDSMEILDMREAAEQKAIAESQSKGGRK